MDASVATAARSTGSATAAPLPSPRRMPRSRIGVICRRCSATECAGSVDRWPACHQAFAPGANRSATSAAAVTTTPSLLGSLTQAVTPSSDVVGFDASGLIVYAFAGAGIKMPRSSGEQYKVGRKVLPSQALPGDLIFWGPDGSQSVALFIGNGQMVESTPPAVTVSKVRTDGMTPYLVRVIDQ